MTQRTAQRFAVAAVLAAVVILGAAAPAQARDLGPADAWQRLQNLWTKAVSILLEWSGPPALQSGSSGPLHKAGPASDPNGSPSPAPPPTGNDGDAGHATDPNG